MRYDLRRTSTQTEMLKKLSGQILIDLKELEGDYRSTNLPVDKAQSIVYLIIVSISVLLLTSVDRLVFKDQPDLFWMMVFYRFVSVVFTLAIVFAIMRTDKVRVFDRLILLWISATIFSLLLFNFTRPHNYLTTVFDIIVVFAIYALSPLRIQTNILLAVVFSLGTLFIDFFIKTGVDPVNLNVALSAQFIVHALGWGAAVQLHSYRRRSYKAFIDERDAKEMVAYLANIDPLTKSLTRRHFFNIAETEFKRFVRYRRPLSVLVIDADAFKAINDNHGHHAGDIVLRSFSLVAMEQKRVQDTFGRLGGEEFGLILPETNLEQACVVAERIRSVWEQTPSNLDGRLLACTVSIGVAEVQTEDKTFDDVLRRADLMMYKAKQLGRNRVVSENKAELPHQ
jgi:diguanylate cyclase (GGDEF)-like protein